MKKFFLLLLALIFTAPLAALAEKKPSQLHFLETFAVREYERGNMANAAKEFQRILRIDPQNPLALEYVKKLSVLPADTGATNPRAIDQAIADIATVRNSLSEFEKDSAQLKSLIRSLMTDNDAMYQILYSRSREVAELRSKLSGTPYEQTYAQAMDGLPIDRVPQHLHKADDILPDNPQTPPRANEDAVNALVEELYPNIARKRLVGDVFYAPHAMPPGALDKALGNHREALIEKTIATAGQLDNLTRLRDDLAAINASLKQADDRYAQASKMIDEHYQHIEDNVARKDAVDQKIFAQLVKDYADRVKEIEELKAAARQQDAAIAAHRPVLAAADDRLQSIEQAMPKEPELAQLKAELTAYKDFLTRQEHRNAATEAAVTTTASHITDLQHQLASLAEDLERPKDPVIDNGKKALEARAADLEAKLQTARDELDAAKASLNNLTIREQNLLQDVKMLPVMAARVKELEALRKTPAEIKELEMLHAAAAAGQGSTRGDKNLLEAKARIAALAKDIEEKDTLIKDLRAKAIPYEQRIADLSHQVATLSSDARCLHPAWEVNRPKDDRAASELDARWRRTEATLAATETQLVNAHNEAAALRRKLADRDSLMAQLKAAPLSELCSLSLDVTEKDTRINELQNEVFTLQQALKEISASLQDHPAAVTAP